MSPRVLVTGGTGFIGRQALPELRRRGFDVHAIARRAVPATEGVHWHRADLLKEEDRRGILRDVRPSHLLHLAWYVEHRQFWRAPENIDWLSASADLLRGFEQLGGERAVFVGSCAEYDWQRSDRTPWRESDPCRPGTYYGQMKYWLSEIVSGFAARTGLSCAWARLFLLFGPGEHPDRFATSLTRALLQGRPAVCASGNLIRDFMHVRDVAAVLAQLLAGGTTGAVNVASGKPVALAEVARLIAEYCGRPHLLEVAERHDQAGEPEFMVADVTRLRAEVGFTTPLSLRERFASFVRACEEELLVDSVGRSDVVVAAEH